MRKASIILLILVFSTSILTAQSKYFTGEVHKIDKYKKQITCEGEDLTPIKVGQFIYICDKNKKLIATVKVIRFYTTVIETTLVSGNLDVIKVKMPVYSSKSQFEKKRSKEVKHLTEKAIGGMKFVYIKGGEFMMGSPENDSEAEENEKPQHKVSVDSFWMGKYEVTVKDFSKFIIESGYKTDADKQKWTLRIENEGLKIEGANWKYNKNGKEDYKGILNHPVIHISWNDTISFCEWFSKKYKVKARLPYEAEWEYACRAGTTTKYYWGNEMKGEYCWYRDNSNENIHPVGQKNPNKWGFFDMAGNLREWCMDWIDQDYYKKNFFKNPKGPDIGEKKVLRGGNWYEVDKRLGSANRDGRKPTGIGQVNGFRVAISPGLIVKGKKTEEDFNNALYELYISQGDSLCIRNVSYYKEAIAVWNKIPKSSKYYKEAQEKIERAKRILFKEENWELKKYVENLPENAIGGLTFIYIKGGEFMMGSPDSYPDVKPHEKPLHKVSVDSFWMGKYEVTVKDFSKFIIETGYKTDADKQGWAYRWRKKGKGQKKEKKEGMNWKCNVNGIEDYKGRLEHPVIYISWNDAIAYCEWFKEKYKVKARLPYEAEWEYACRSGTTTRHYWGDGIEDNYCWYVYNSEKETHPVGQKRPNKWGLYNMSGNVSELCMDWYGEDYYKTSPYKNPIGLIKGKHKVVRGGSLRGRLNRVDSANRDMIKCNQMFNHIGFRVAISPK